MKPGAVKLKGGDAAEICNSIQTHPSLMMDQIKRSYFFSPLLLIGCFFYISVSTHWHSQWLSLVGSITAGKKRHIFFLNFKVSICTILSFKVHRSWKHSGNRVISYVVITYNKGVGLCYRAAVSIVSHAFTSVNFWENFLSFFSPVK